MPPNTACALRAAADSAEPLDRTACTHGTLPCMLAPEVTVAAIAEDAGRFLLVEERIKQRRVFNQPAGHGERGETLLAAVVREAREESAWRFVPRALVGIYLWRNPATRRPILRFAFAGTVCEHDPAQPLDRGILTTHWLTPGPDVEGAEGGRGTA